ncbi:MAG: glutaredoxin family protein [Kineosporiaceae bacterium]
MSPRITLIGKPGCHLCDDAREVVARVADSTGAGWEERSILDDAELHERWWDQIPVVLVDGRVHDVFRVHEAALREALVPAQAPDAGGAGAAGGWWQRRRRGR